MEENSGPCANPQAPTRTQNHAMSYEALILKLLQDEDLAMTRAALADPGDVEQWIREAHRAQAIRHAAAYGLPNIE